jgi:hypothetical protein
MRQLDRRQRFFVQSIDALLDALGEWMTPVGEATSHESIFFDDPLLTLGGDARAIARRRTDEHDETREPHYAVDVPKKLRSPFALRDEGLPLAGATDAVQRAFGSDAIAPYCMVRWKRQHYALGTIGSLTLDTDVSYSGFVDGRFVDAGKECHPRVRLRLDTRPSRKLDAALTMLPRLPHSSKRWMGYFRMRKLVKPKRINELPGYEYEIKLDSDRAHVDPACLPFPIHRVYQTESTRYYYEGHRIQFRAFRTERATLVRKGDVEIVDGVPRRPEEKQRGLSPWQLARPRYALRRIKKTYLLLHPATQRMYNLCLEVCRAEGDDDAEMTQIEIEYRGRVALPTKAEPREAIERAVVADMRAIERALMTHHGMKSTRASKRSWLQSLKKLKRTAV